MNKSDRKIIQTDIVEMLENVISDDYLMDILRFDNEGAQDTILNDIIDDVLTSSAWTEEGYYSEDDIKLAIGRVLIDRLGIIR